MSDAITNNVPETNEDVKWYIKYKQQLYGIGLVIFGLCGGNVDRLYEMAGEFLPTNVDIEEIQNRVSILEDSVNDIDNRVRLLEVSGIHKAQWSGLSYRTGE